MKKIIVTGGLGYIGSHTVCELSLAGYEPVIIDNLSNTSIENLYGIEKLLNKRIAFHQIDCANATVMEQFFSNIDGVLGVVHFAAYKSVEESVFNPDKYYANNVGSMEVMINCCEQFGIENLIFSSSCTVYGQPEQLPVTEQSPFLKAFSPYGHSKQLCEELLDATDLNSVSLRYFNPIGAHPSALIGDRSGDKPANLVPILTQVAAQKKDKLMVFGDDYNTIDGSCVRDYIHVQDLAESHVKALEYLLANRGKDVFNIGTGKGLSVLKAIQLFEEANQIKVPFQIIDRRAGDVACIYADTEKAEKKLNWRAKKHFKEAMLDAWNWEIKQNKNE